MHKGTQLVGDSKYEHFLSSALHRTSRKHHQGILGARPSFANRPNVDLAKHGGAIEGTNGMSGSAFTNAAGGIGAACP